MRQYKIYLSGPIASLSPNEALSWRTYAQKFLSEKSNGEVIGVCPMRNSLYSKGSKIDMSDDVVGNSHRIKVRCAFDVKDCDLMFINVKNAPARISMGTCWELGAATVLEKTVVCVTDKGSQYEKDILFSASVDSFLYYDLDVGLQRCIDFLLP